MIFFLNLHIFRRFSGCVCRQKDVFFRHSTHSKGELLLLITELTANYFLFTQEVSKERLSLGRVHSQSTRAHIGKGESKLGQTKDDVHIFSKNYPFIVLIFSILFNTQVPLMSLSPFPLQNWRDLWTIPQRKSMTLLQWTKFNKNGKPKPSYSACSYSLLDEGLLSLLPFCTIHCHLINA